MSILFVFQFANIIWIFFKFTLPEIDFLIYWLYRNTTRHQIFIILALTNLNYLYFLLLEFQPKQTCNWSRYSSASSNIVIENVQLSSFCIGYTCVIVSSVAVLCFLQLCSLFIIVANMFTSSIAVNCFQQLIFWFRRLIHLQRFWGLRVAA